MHLPDGCLCLGREEVGVDGVTGHEFGDELLAPCRREAVGVWERHGEEVPSQTLPERGSAILCLEAPHLGDHALVEPFRVLGEVEHA